MEKTYRLTPRQDAAYSLLTNDKDCSVLYGGAKGGGKSYLLCLWVLVFCRWLIDYFGIKERQKNPLPVGFIGRKRGVDFSKTTLETWKAIIPSTSYMIREQDKEIIIDGKVKVFFGGLDDENVINKFNSAEFVFFAIDQAEETDRGDLSVLGASLRRTYLGKQPPYKKLYTANPAECWLKEDFITNPKEGYYYIPALPTDNPYLPDNYLKTLDEFFGYDPVMLKAYKEGNWDLLQKRSSLITQPALDSLKGVYHNYPFTKKIVANDPAIGGDECVFYFMENYEIKDTLILHINDTQKIGAEAIAFMARHECDNYIGDGIGVGKGVVDYISACGKNVIEFISSERADDEEHFANRRAEIHYYTATKILRREIPYPDCEKLRRQLCAIEHKIGTKKFELTPKKETKVKLGESPDRHDTFTMGIWGSDQIDEQLEYGIESIRVRHKKTVFSGAAGY